MPGRQFCLMRAAMDQLVRAPGGLPKKLKREATPRAEQGEAAAETAAMFFEKLAPTFNSVKYDEAEARAKPTEPSRIIEEAKATALP